MSINTDTVKDAVLELTAALEYVDKIQSANLTNVSYETMQRSGFKRKSWKRKYTMLDAKQDAKTAAIRLRKAWELLEPITLHSSVK